MLALRHQPGDKFLAVVHGLGTQLQQGYGYDQVGLGDRAQDGVAETRGLFAQQLLQRVLSACPVGVALVRLELHLPQEFLRGFIEKLELVEIAQAEHVAFQQAGAGSFDTQGAAGQPDFRQGGAQEVVGYGVAVVGCGQLFGSRNVIYRGVCLVEAADQPRALQSQHRGAHLLLVLQAEPGGRRQAALAHQGGDIPRLGVDLRGGQGASVGAQQHHGQHVGGFDRGDLLDA